MSFSKWSRTISIFEANGTAVYLAPGTYEWTIKADGYEDATITVIVIPQF